jgi:DNA segregation ATPase FtsK/SpoIIIE-like protein
MLLHLRTKGETRYWFLEHAFDVTATCSRPDPSADREMGLRRNPCAPERPEETSALADVAPTSPTIEERPNAGSNAAEEASFGPQCQLFERDEAIHASTSPALGQATLLANVLRAVGIRFVEVDSRPTIGPNVVRYHVTLEPAERTENLRRRAEDIGREMGCNVFISSLPGQRFVAIDVPRPDRQLVQLAPALDDLQRTAMLGPGQLRMLVGAMPAGEPVIIDLAMLPHLLLAGASGSGKSFWMLRALLGLALLVDPSQLELVIIDPKGLDFAPLAHLPHVRRSEIVEDPAAAIEVLREITGSELAARTRLLQQAGCANFRELRIRHPDSTAKNLVIAIDEYADIVTSLPKDERDEFERQVLRLAQRARAVGVHLMIATQRPTVDLITGGVKANLPSRISFRLPQRADSLVILDQPGAEMLLGAGDMLLLHEGHLQRLQGYYASTSDVAALVGRISERRTR